MWNRFDGNYIRRKRKERGGDIEGIGGIFEEIGNKEFIELGIEWIEKIE